MTRHFIHYLPRRVVVRFPSDPESEWFAEARGLAGAFARPAIHVTRRMTGPAMNVRAGDTIWLVSQLVSPWGKLPPGLDARIEVGKAIERDGVRRLTATDNSEWFPLSDATTTLRALKTVADDGSLNDLWRKPKSPIGYYIQSMRMLASEAPLLSWRRRSMSRPYDFISYRVLDGTRAAFQLANALVSRGRQVFWDRWSLPRRLAERRERVSDENLDRHLMERLEGAATVWGVDSPFYSAEGSYSRREFVRARELGTYRKPTHFLGG